jgi:hypothetical protein
MRQANPVKSVVGEFALERGMVWRSRAWYRPGDEVIGVIQHQKSPYGRQYYLELAFWLNNLGMAEFPEETHCQVRIRANRVLPDRASELAELLDLENALSDVDRSTRLRAFLMELTPFLEQASSVEGLRQLYRDGALRAALIRGPAVELLSRRAAPPAVGQ